MTHSEAGLLDYGRIAYSLPVGTDGGRFTASYLQTDYSVGDPAFAILDPEGNSYTARGEYTYPLVRSRNSNKVLSVAVTGTQTETYALGTLTDSSEILLLEVAMFGNNVLGDRRTNSWSLGYSGNGKFNDGGRDNEQCCKLFGDYAFTVPVGEAWYTKAKIRGAWAPDQLADVERFSLGGPYSVRGYASSELRGDTGFDGTVEFHRPMNFLGGNADLLFFGDVGQVASNVTGTSVASDVLASVGVGFTAFDIYGFECNLSVARAVGNYDSADGEGGRAFLSIGTRF
jgi:hemolysin activation/secretion protein